MTARARTVAAPGLAALLAAAAWLQGAFYVRQIVPVAIATVAVAAIAGLPAKLPKEVAYGFACLAAGLLASAAANGFPAAAGKSFATLAFCAAVFVLASRAAEVEHPGSAVDAVLAVAATVAVLGLIGVAFHVRTWAFEAGSWRLSSTLTYQNSAAALFALALPAAMLRPRRIHRAAAALLVVALGATQSRAGMLGAMLGLAVVFALSRPKHLARFSVGVSIALAALLPALAGVKWSGLLAIVVTPFGVAVAAADPRGEVRAGRAARLTSATVAMLAVAALATAALLATPVGDRFSATSNDRAAVWRATLARIAAHPLLGSGPGTFRLERTVDGEAVVTRHAHNEYLEFTADTGLAGLASTLVAMAWFAVALGRRRVPVARPAWIAAAAAGVALSSHAAFDFVWHVPLLPACAFALLAAATASRVESSPSF